MRCPAKNALPPISLQMISMQGRLPALLAVVAWHCASAAPFGWVRFPARSWAVIESAPPDADGRYGRDAGSIAYLGTFATAGECAMACREYRHRDAACLAFTHYHFNDAARALQCLGITDALPVRWAAGEGLSPSEATSAAFVQQGGTAEPSALINHPWDGDVVTSKGSLYLEVVWTSMYDGTLHVSFTQTSYSAFPQASEPYAEVCASVYVPLRGRACPRPR